MLEARRLTKKYGDFTAVNNLSFFLEKGQTLVLLGTSGCGKTTTLKMLNQLIEPSSGEVLIAGKDAKSYAPHQLRRQIGYVLQSPALFPHLTIGKNIGMVPQMLGWPKSKIANRVEELMLQLNLETRLASYLPEALSGGQQQRVGLARALAANPDMVLMDEPFGALDPITRTNIRQEFLSFAPLRHKTIVMVTHDVEEAFQLGDLICLMDKGEVQQLGTPDDLLFRPAKDFVSNFLLDKRFALMSNQLTIGDLLPYLSAFFQETPQKQDVLDEKTTLAQAMHQLTETGEDICLRLAGTQGFKKVSWQGLMDAFWQKTREKNG